MVEFVELVLITEVAALGRGFRIVVRRQVQQLVFRGVFVLASHAPNPDGKT
jgi:hypothetical protein